MAYTPANLTFPLSLCWSSNLMTLLYSLRPCLYGEKLSRESKSLPQPSQNFSERLYEETFTPFFQAESWQQRSRMLWVDPAGLAK